ncbi:DUF4031 domain-containing protein [Agromyces sp. NPDC057679]|uniref:DUF4031 domain-containing protein n=1 Tax=Agromyces sp. NPDC057679 TaxID=3346207 RepID=UPI00366B0A44
MTVYVDNARIPAAVPNGRNTVRGVWCHMTADTRDELDEMADRLGLKRTWIQHPGTWKEHYDVTEPKRRAAVAAGAVEVEALAHMRNFLMPRMRGLSATETGHREEDHRG